MGSKNRGTTTLLSLPEDENQSEYDELPTHEQYAVRSSEAVSALKGQLLAAQDNCLEALQPPRRTAYTVGSLGDLRKGLQEEIEAATQQDQANASKVTALRQQRDQLFERYSTLLEEFDGVNVYKAEMSAFDSINDKIATRGLDSENSSARTSTE